MPGHPPGGFGPFCRIHSVLKTLWMNSTPIRGSAYFDPGVCASIRREGWDRICPPPGPTIPRHKPRRHGGAGMTSHEPRSYPHPPLFGCALRPGCLVGPALRPGCAAGSSPPPGGPGGEVPALSPTRIELSSDAAIARDTRSKAWALSWDSPRLPSATSRSAMTSRLM